MSEAALRSMHVGAVVHDLERAIAEHSVLGIGPWTLTGHLRTPTYDGERGSVIEQEVRLVFGALPGGGAVELVEPRSGTPASPQRRLLEERPGVTHSAFWCRSVLHAAKPLLDAGARVLTISLPQDAPWRDRLDDGGERALLELSSACYLTLPSATIVELVSVSVAASLESALGPVVHQILPVPPDWRTS